MENKECKAIISNKMSKSMWIFLAVYCAVVVILIGVGFIVGVHVERGMIPTVPQATSYKHEYVRWFELEFSEKWYWEWDNKTEFSIETGNVVLFVFILLVFAAIPVVFGLLKQRQRKLTSLTAYEKELIGCYFGFIPISKIQLRMPIEKVDNIVAVKTLLSFYDGKMLRISSTSGVIKIPYVENADEVVAFIVEAIKNAQKEVSQAQQPVSVQSDVADSLKKLAELKNSGIITEEEFNQKKSDLLGKM